MAWARLEGSVRSSPKIARLARALGVPVAHARGLVCGLWAWAVEARPDGDLAGMDAGDISYACEWDGDPADLLVALVDAALVDGGSGAYTIHGWAERMGSYREAARQAASRLARRASATVTNASATVTGQSRDNPQMSRGEEKRRKEKRALSDLPSGDPHPGSQASAGQGEPGQALALIATEPPPQAPPTRRAAKAGATDAARASYADQAREVWSHYRERWHPRVAPDLLPGSHEYRAICDRLREGSSVADLRDAIDGCHGDPWHQGANDKGAKYLSITLICRSASHVQRYRELLARPARAMSAHETQAMSAAQRFINGSA